MAEDVEGTQMTGVVESAKKTFTPAERVQQLNEIDKDVARLLRAAGQAIKSLTTNHPEGLSTVKAPPLSLHKTAFTTATTTYFILLQSISQRLKAQIRALEDAEIIAPEPAVGDKTANGVTGTGLGNLDVGWLNSNISDVVGREMEGELWGKAREFLEGLERAKVGIGEEKGGMKI